MRCETRLPSPVVLGTLHSTLEQALDDLAYEEKLGAERGVALRKPKQAKERYSPRELYVRLGLPA